MTERSSAENLLDIAQQALRDLLEVSVMGPNGKWVFVKSIERHGETDLVRITQKYGKMDDAVIYFDAAHFHAVRASTRAKREP